MTQRQALPGGNGLPILGFLQAGNQCPDNVIRAQILAYRVLLHLSLIRIREPKALLR